MSWCAAAVSLALVVLSLLDAYVTLLALGTVEGAVELNPFAALLIQHDWWVLAKAGTAVLAAAMVFLGAREASKIADRGELGRAWVYAIMAMGLAACVWQACAIANNVIMMGGR